MLSITDLLQEERGVLASDLTVGKCRLHMSILNSCKAGFWFSFIFCLYNSAEFELLIG